MKIIKNLAAILLASSLGACAVNSALIHKNDPTFSQAQQRIQHIQKIVGKLNSSNSEKNLFLQAESFYQYRFLPPKKNTAKYLSEAASAITDFPGFQSLSGSLGFEDLRFRSSDSAVQLWESLLESYPKTKLKPLTLYRLGFAYQNVGAQGLPRSDPNEAFDELIKDYPDNSLAKLAKKAKVIPWKSKETAAVRSLIPGLGQIYLDDTKSGLTRLGIAAFALAAVALPVYKAAHHRRNSQLDVAAGLVGLIVLSFDFTSSFEDAMNGVVLWNEHVEAEFNIANPSAP